MNAKRKGTKNEHRSMRLLESSGYSCTRAAASLGTWDVVGIGPTDVVLLQVKSNRGPSPAEREQMQLFQAPPNCRKLIHVWRDRQRIPLVTTVL